MKKVGRLACIARRTRKTWITALSAFTLSMFVIASLAVPNDKAFADDSSDGSTTRYHSRVWLKCIDNEVTEGDDFRLEVRKSGYDDPLAATIKVYWFTDPITADGSDYHELDGESQVSNRHQSWNRKMGRNFHTRDDEYSEAEETFKVRIENAAGGNNNDECIVTILDDDPVGIVDVEASRGFGYAVAGDVITVRAHFTQPVTTLNPLTGETSDYAAIAILVGRKLHYAEMLRGDGTDTIVFGYTVQEGDRDYDGIDIVPGEPGRPGNGLYFNQVTGDVGLWPVERDQSQQINRRYRGKKNVEYTLVHG